MVRKTLRWRRVDSNHQYRVTPPRFRQGVKSAPLASHQPKGSTNEESRHHGNAGGSCAVLMVRIRLPSAESRTNLLVATPVPLLRGRLVAAPEPATLVLLGSAPLGFR